MKSDTNFVKELQVRVNLLDYSKKLKEKAINFEIWNDKSLIGLLSIYKTNENNFFITNICVISEYLGQGLGTEMINQAVNKGQEYSIKQMLLEVNVENALAIKFYEDKGFKSYKQEGHSIYMNLKITEDV
jgi:ribosomal-protein-alanine N-acetyltransferase